MITLLGLAAGVLTTACWLPQLRRSWRTRSTADLSWTYLLLLTVGVGLWLVYGLVAADVAVVVANSATAAALVTLAAFKLTFDRLSPAGRPHQVGPDRVDALP